MGWTKDQANSLRDWVIFKSLTDQEEVYFREWARKNYKPGTYIKEAWHPVIRNECLLINGRR